MASSTSAKRSSSARDRLSPSPAPTKRRKAKQKVNIQTLAPTDHEVLERAAALLNIPVHELLESTTRNGSLSAASLSFPGSPAQSSMGVPASPQPWFQAPYTTEHDDIHHDSASSSGGFTGQGTPSDLNQLSTQSGMDTWLPNFELDITGMPSTPYVPSMAVGGQRIFGTQQMHLPGSILSGQLESPGAEELAGTPYDQASDIASIVESPQWQDVPISSIAANKPYDDRNDAWLNDAQVLASTSTQPASGVHSPNASYQMVRSSSTTGEWDIVKHQGRSPFTDKVLRDETSATRKLKACVRCRMQKIRCVIDENDPIGTCKTCQSVSKQRLYTLPCARYKITECALYRIGKAPGLEFTFRWPVMKLKDISMWANKETRTISVLSDVCSLPYTLQVRQFVPLPQDSQSRGWMDGKLKKFVETTPFAIVNMSNAVKHMREYIDKNVTEGIAFFLQETDPLIKETYAFAIKHAERHGEDEEGILMGNFLRLWFAIRRTHTVEHIVSKDTLDMEPLRDKSCPLVGKVLLPPVMIQQLDMILTLGILRPLRKKVLDDLQKLIMSNKPSSWLTVYLTTFMSLHQCATICAENYRNARRQGLRVRPPSESKTACCELLSE